MNHHPNPRTCTSTLALTLLLACAQPAWAQAAPAPEASRISAVMLYPGSATVVRELRLAAGATKGVFACLPAALDVASLQAAGDQGVRVGEISVRQLPRELLGKACASPLDERIRALEDPLAALQAESAGIDYATGFLGRFTLPEGDPARAAPGSQIAAAATALRQTGQEALQRKHQLMRQQEAIERELKPLVAERDRASRANAQVSVVQVTLTAPQGGKLRLSYQLRGPGWQPGYRAFLDSNTRKLRLERLAQVAQATGEDWGEVALTLSTGQPNAATQGPLPRPWRVGLQPPREALESARLMAAPAPAPMAAARPPQAKADEGGAMPSFDASVFQGSFATEFALPQRVSVPSSGERVTLSLGEQALGTQLVTRTTPLRDAHAYLIASLATPPGVWPVGSVALYRDGAYVGSARLDMQQIQRDGLAFGRDELVSVRVEQPEQQQGTGGFIGTRNQRTDFNRYWVENRHRDAITLQVLDAAPMPEHEDVRVESSYQPAPQTERWHEQAGTIAWEQPLAAGATQAFSAKHIISWPKDARLRER